MSSSQIEIQSDSTKESDSVVSDPAQNNTSAVIIDNIFDASIYGDLEKLRKFVEQDGASLSSPDKSRDNGGCYALHWAAANNHTEIVRYILEHGGDVNAVNKSQQTAFHFAANGGHISIADVLLQNGAQFEAADEYGFRAVHFAARQGKALFLNHIGAKYNANFDIPDKYGRRPLHLAAMENHHEIVQCIIELGGDVNAVNNHHQTTLHIAAEEGLISVADVLLQNGAQIEAADKNGCRALHYATAERKALFLNHIGAKYNANFDIPDNEGRTPLHWAASKNDHEIVQCIIELGGDVNAVDNYHQTALHIAAREGLISVADVLLQNGARIEAADEDGCRAVHLAVGNRQLLFLKHIVAKHNVDLDVPDNLGRSPLHWATSLGRVDAITWLLSKNACQKRQEINGRTPLHYAALGDQIDAFIVLKDAATEQEIMMKDNDGYTAIELSPSLMSEALYEECKNSSISHFGDIPEGTNPPAMIIAMQGDAYTGKTHLAFSLASVLKCPFICLDDILEASDPTNEKDTLISNAFKIIAQIVKTQIALGNSVIVDSPLSRLSHLQNLACLDDKKCTKLLIMECKPKNEYAYQLRFEEKGEEIYSKIWYKSKKAWPLPKDPRDYTDDDIPSGVSKLVVDTSDNIKLCRILEAVLDITSCGYGHKTKYHFNREFIHKDKEEQFTCPCPRCKLNEPTEDANLHTFTFREFDDCLRACGVCQTMVGENCYICTDMDCRLALHKSCAELARGEKKHFVPKNFPIFMSSKPRLTWTFPVEHPCTKCRKAGKGFSSKCKVCLFRSHMMSRLVPTVVHHKAHDYILTFWVNSDAGDSMFKYICMACKEDGVGAAYCLWKGFFYHPQCALLPPSLSHSHCGYTHDLEMITRRFEKEEDYLCDCCLNKMDPSMWYYYCRECNISMHLKCAFLDFDTGGSITEACS